MFYLNKGKKILNILLETLLLIKKLIKSEIERRESSKKDKLLKNTGFYTIKSFEDFNFNELTLPVEVIPEYLKNLEFIVSKTNLVMYGNMETGKTFLSIALGVTACKKGIEVRFFRTSALVNKLAKAKKNGALSEFIKQISKAQLLICDG